MSKFQKLFRYLWRINAVLILVAAGSIVFGVAGLIAGEVGARTAGRREAEAGIPVAPAADSNAHLSLRRASVVEGTNFMRADLSLDHAGKGFSSGGYSETRNILFISPLKMKDVGCFPTTIISLRRIPTSPRARSAARSELSPPWSWSSQRQARPKLREEGSFYSTLLAKKS